MPDRTSRIDSDRLQERLVDLVRIPSVTGDEEAAIRRIADWLSAAGAEVDYWYDGIAKLVADPAYPGHEIERAWLPVVAGMIRGTRPDHRVDRPCGCGTAGRLQPMDDRSVRWCNRR